jgi:hypothetical protein
LRVLSETTSKLKHAPLHNPLIVGAIITLSGSSGYLQLHLLDQPKGPFGFFKPAQEGAGLGWPNRDLGLAHVRIRSESLRVQ